MNACPIINTDNTYSEQNGYKYLSVFLLLLLPFLSQAQMPDSLRYHVKGAHNVQLGIGFPNRATVGVSIINAIAGTDLSAKASPQATLKYEYGLTSQLGVGVHMGFYTAQTGEIPFVIENNIQPDLQCCLNNPLDECCLGGISIEQGSSSYSIRSATLGARFAYHRVFIDEIDTYTALSAGYNFLSYKEDGDQNEGFRSIEAPTFYYFFSGGAKYQIGPKWGVYGEIGYGSLTIVNIGASYRILK